MKRFLGLLLLLAILAGTLALAPGCKSSSGSRDFIPGSGWVPND
jgi:hypothetical protein